MPQSATNTTYTDIYNDQTTLNKEYSDYTNAYLTYIDCSAQNITIANINKKNLSSDPLNACNLPTTGSLDAAISKMQTNVASLHTNDQTAIIDASYGDLVNIRSNLDLKLQQLYNLQNSAPNIYQTQLDSTIYSGILWTVLATTLIYYVFIKL